MPRLASAALALTVIPGNLGDHMFWSESDPERKAEKRRAFLSDMSLLGGLIIAAVDTAGKPSWGWRGRRAAERIPATVAGALAEPDHTLLDSDIGEKIMNGLHAGAERGRELANTAAEKSVPLAEAALGRGRELAHSARVRGAEFAETARHQGSHLADTAMTRGNQLADTARKRIHEQASEIQNHGGRLWR